MQSSLKLYYFLITNSRSGTERKINYGATTCFLYIFKAVIFKVLLLAVQMGQYSFLFCGTLELE
jgi:hypothetical protein